jgi:hypothetical protein
MASACFEAAEVAVRPMPAELMTSLREVAHDVAAEETVPLAVGGLCRTRTAQRR